MGEKKENGKRRAIVRPGTRRRLEEKASIGQSKGNNYIKAEGNSK